MVAQPFLNDDNRNLKALILSLQARFGRLPTEDEVVGFINGDQEARERIWNSYMDAELIDE